MADKTSDYSLRIAITNVLVLLKER